MRCKKNGLDMYLEDDVAALVRVSVISEWCGPEREGRWWCFQEGNQSADWVIGIV